VERLVSIPQDKDTKYPINSREELLEKFSSASQKDALSVQRQIGLGKVRSDKGGGGEWVALGRKNSDHDLPNKSLIPDAFNF